ncbi:MAG: DNA polymerase III subunit alpha [Ruminococcaceae bacterium]|nr:DNA polymerase III subunit alpha [Oscillospiraceae bacterium]
MKEFVHLHLHSEYSLLDGACRVTEIPEAVAKCGQNAVAITDHGVMYGTLKFWKECKNSGIKPIIGCEVYVAPGSMNDRSGGRDTRYYHLVLLVKNNIGYKNLIHMVSKAFTEGFYSKPRIDMELLRNHSEGLVALSACLAGYIPRCLAIDDFDEAKRHAEEMKSIFGDDYYIELQDHGLEEQKYILPKLAELARITGIPMVATNDVHYLRREDAENQAILMCIQTNTTISEGKPVGFETDEFYLKSGDEMYELFSEYEGAVENTVHIAEKCNFDFETNKTYLPRYDVPTGTTPGEYLKKLSEEGIIRRKNAGLIPSDTDDYSKRMEYELSVIDSMGYSEYFLIVWDFVNHARTKKIPVGPGRGSGAGSIVAYLIGITDVDPIKYGLLFERFLNPERVSMPDFDIDFCYNRRDEVIDYVRQKYGDDHVAQIITFGTMAAKAVIRDAGRALGMSYGDVDRVAKLIPRDLGITLKESLERREIKAAYDSDGEVRRLFDVGMALEGMPRHASTHAAGVVITDEPVTSYVPIAENSGFPVTQFTMDGVAELGLLKFDFLALRYLTIIDAAERQIQESEPNFDITTVSDDDKSVYEMIGKGLTDGVFQLESGGMKQMLQRLKPCKFEEIIAAIALYRPGPMDSIPKYIENRNGGNVKGYAIPGVDEILADTYGCIVYQEQVMQIFRTVAGYSYGRADIVRRAISKKHGDELERERNSFYEGAAERGVDISEAERLFNDIAGFANYAFNKSHAAAYAVLSYRTAYLKCHYPLEYFCALLTSVIGNPGKISEYISEYAKQGIRVLPPDINKSYTEFHAETDAVRFPLSAIRNVGITFTQLVIKDRKENGEYKSFTDFIVRAGKLGLNRRLLESLAKCGALDSLGEMRSRIISVIDKAMEIADGGKGDDGQIGMFGSDDSSGIVPVINFPQIPEMSVHDKLLLEKEYLGVFASGHILDDYSEHVDLIEPNKIFEIKESDAFSSKDSVVLCGTVTRRSIKDTRKGERMAFITLEDGSGEIEVIIFSTLYQRCGYLINSEAPICISGTVSDKDGDELRVICNDIIILINNEQIGKAISIPIPEKKTNTPVMRPVYTTQNTVNNDNLTAQPRHRSSKLYLSVDPSDKKLYERLFCFFEIFSGAVPVVLYNKVNKTYAKDTGIFVSASAMMINELKELLGNDSVVLK